MKETKTIKFKTIKANFTSSIPKNFTGIAEYPSGTKVWYKEGKYHREDGPAIEWIYGSEEWYLKNISYIPIDLKDFVVLDHYQGNYNIMWYKLLDENKVFEYPDVPGLIIK
jgi:hypothetical protein